MAYPKGHLPTNGFKKGGVSPRKGVKLSEETKKKISNSKIGQKSPNKGKITSEIVKKKQSESFWKHYKSENHYNWKGGSSKGYKTGYYSLEYKKWRMAVFERDNYTCQNCNTFGKYITAHHIKSFSKFPDLRFSLENGVTLCEPCHKLTDNYKGRARNV